jgi:predicted Zn-dependent protease
VVARNQDTASLTKHLRQYGGTGKYNDFAIGRVLRNITFSGKGLVENPANEESIIFNNVESFDGSSAKSVYINLSGDLNNTNQELSMADTELNNKITNLEGELSKASADKVTLENEVKTLKDKVASLETALAAKTTETETLNTKVSELTETIAKAEKDSLKAKRVAAFVAVNAPAEEAEALVADLMELKDEAFARVVEVSKSKWVVADAPAPAKTEEEVAAEADKAAAATLESAKPDADAALNSADASVEENGKALQDALRTLFKN